MAALPAWLLPLVLGAALLHLLGDVLAPFALAGVLAYVFQPAVARLHRLGLPRGLAAAAVLALLMAALVGLALLMLPMLMAQTAALAERVPQMLALLQDRLPVLLDRFGVGADPMGELQALATRHAGELAAWLRGGLSRAGQGGAALATLLGTLALFPVVLFYALRDLPGIAAALLSLCPAALQDALASLAADADAVLGEFVRGQLGVMLAMAAVYAVALQLLGVPHAFSIGVLAGLLTFVPLVGVVLGGALAIGAAALLPGDSAPWWAVALAFVAGNLFENFVVTPWLVGERIGLHPLTVIFALLAFGKLFGLSGVLVALPATAVLQAWLRRWQTRTARRP